MEQTQKTPVVSNDATEQKTATKKAAKKQVQSTKMVNVYEVIGESRTIHAFDLADFPKGIGQMLSQITGKGEFTYLGKKFTFVALSANNSNRHRAANIFKQLITNVFPVADNITVLQSDTDECKAILTLKAIGLKFKTVCKKEVAEAFNVKLKNWKVKENLHREVVRKLNAETIAETKVIGEAVKEMKADNLAAITGFQKRYVKAIEAAK